jgi:hypothetical protein
MLQGSNKTTYTEKMRPKEDTFETSMNNMDEVCKHTTEMHKIIGDLVKQNRRLMSALEDRASRPKSPYEETDEFRKLKDSKSKAEDEARQWKDANTQLKEKLNEQEDRNWELRYENQDKKHELEKLETKLRNSISMGEGESSPLMVKTALEKRQEKRIEELQQELRDIKKVAWKEATRGNS